MADLDVIRRALKKAKLPRWVESTDVSTFTDHAGEASVRVTVVIRAGDEAKVVKNGAALNELSRKIHEVVAATGVTLLPYTRFVGASEAAA